MTTNLAPLYARYGLLASFTLDVLQTLKDIAERGETDLVPRGDDRVRFERLRQMLNDSLQGEMVSGTISRPIKSLGPRTSRSAGRRRSTRGKLDDSIIVKRTLPENYDIVTFVRKASHVLDQIIEKGIDHVKGEDRAFLDGEMTDFLTRLADGNDYVVPVSRRARERISLA